MATTVTMSLSVYQSIVASYEALKVVDSADETDVAAIVEALKALLRDIDSSNTLTRHYLSIRWYDLDARPADYADYPPLTTVKLYSYTAFTQDYVTDYIGNQTSNYTEVYVTDDPTGTVGWVALATFFS